MSICYKNQDISLLLHAVLSLLIKCTSVDINKSKYELAENTPPHSGTHNSRHRAQLVAPILQLWLLVTSQPPPAKDRIMKSQQEAEMQRRTV